MKCRGGAPEELVGGQARAAEGVARVALSRVKLVVDLEREAAAAAPHGEPRAAGDAEVVVDAGPAVGLEGGVEGEHEGLARSVVVLTLLRESKKKQKKWEAT